VIEDIYVPAKGDAIIRAVIHPAEEAKAHGRKEKLEQGSPRIMWGIFYRRSDRSWLRYRSEYHSQRAANKAMRAILSRSHLLLSEWVDATMPMLDIEDAIDGDPMNMRQIGLPDAADTPH
jgi:hypothetical protein